MGTMEQNVSEKVNSLGKNQVPKPLVVTLKGLVVFFQINRLEGQVSRYKAAADNSEKIEDELKAEKRKLQREVKILTVVIFAVNQQQAGI